MENCILYERPTVQWQSTPIILSLSVDCFCQITKWGNRDVAAFYVQGMACLLFVSPECWFSYSMWLQSNRVEITYSSMQSHTYYTLVPIHLQELHIDYMAFNLTLDCKFNPSPNVWPDHNSNLPKTHMHIHTPNAPLMDQHCLLLAQTDKQSSERATYMTD